MNKDYLESLPTEDQQLIQDLYQQVVEKELSPAQFFSRVKDQYGQPFLTALFNKDTTEVKTDHLHDIIQYSGVDLKEEQENIVKETEIGLGMDHDESSVSTEEHMMGALVNTDMFCDFIDKITGTRGMEIDEDCYETIYKILHRKLKDLVTQIIYASKVRVDALRSTCTIKTINDVKRQLWLLEQNEHKEMEKLKVNVVEERKKVRKTVQEREDLVIKKRMSNTVALAALGSGVKSWMGVESQSKENETPFESLYAPFDEREYLRRVKDRSLTMADFLYVMEHDKRYNKSIFTIQLYFS